MLDGTSFIFFMKMRRLLLIFAFLLPFCAENQCFAQDNLKGWELGGNFNFNVQNRMGTVECSPVLGYTVFKNFTVSLGLIGVYAWNRSEDYSLWSYGAEVGARYVLLNVLYLEAKYQFNPYVAKYGGAEVYKERGMNQSAWVGAGYRQSLGNNTYSYIGIIYDLLAPNDLDDNPRINVSVTHCF